MREVLERLRAPEGPFDPQGEWEHRYSVCVLSPERGAKGEHPHPNGTLALKRKPAGEGRLTLEVDFSVSTRGPSGARTRASLTCAADRLATPREWELRAEAVEDGEAVAETTVAETAVVRDGVLVRRGRVERKLKLPRPFTSNWCLLEAVQRLPFDSAPVSFDMLEDLDLFKPEQSLRPAGAVTLELGGRQVRLHGFRQIGRGILPTHYWLDDEHRLIAAAGALRAFIWDTGAAAPRNSRRKKR